VSQAARTPDAPRVAPEDPTIPIPDRQLAGKAVDAPSPHASSPAPPDPPRDPPPPTLLTRDLRPRILAGLFAVAVIAIAAGRLTDSNTRTTAGSAAPESAAPAPESAPRVPPGSAPSEPALTASSADAPPPAADGDADASDVPRTEAAATRSASTAPATNTPVPATRPAGPGSSAAPAPAPSRASLARRECMAQVEAGRLFIEQARQSTDRGDYENQVTREIERLAAARAITEYRLTLVSIRMWGLRDGDTPAAQWWTDQYRRCEATRLRGGEYVVGS
jgi:hypothetical protein